MPVYEYLCNRCGSRASIFLRSMNSLVQPQCQNCSSSDLSRLISRFAVLKPASSGDIAGLDGLDMPEGLEDASPQAVAAWARQMQHQTGEDMGPEFNDMLQRLERGEPIDDDFDPGHDAGIDMLDD